MSSLSPLAPGVHFLPGAVNSLVLEDGRLVEVVAAPEPLAEIRVGEPRDLARLAYHLGNRHLPLIGSGL